jgi:hypothetical protein
MSVVTWVWLYVGGIGRAAWCHVSITRVWEEVATQLSRAVISV